MPAIEDNSDIVLVIHFIVFITILQIKNLRNRAHANLQPAHASSLKYV